MPGTMVSSSRAFTSVNSTSNSVRKALLLPHLKEQKLSLERAGKTSGNYTGSGAVSHSCFGNTWISKTERYAPR